MRFNISAIFLTLNLILGCSFAYEVPGTRVVAGWAMTQPWECTYINSVTGMMWGCGFSQINPLYTFIEPTVRVSEGAIEVTSHILVSAAAEIYFPLNYYPIQQAIAIPITFSTTDSSVIFQLPTIVTYDYPRWAHGIARRKVASGAPTSQITVSPNYCDPTKVCFYGTLNWMPAVYQAKFTLTCYVLSVETDPKFNNSPLSSGVAGLPPNSTYLTSFLKDVQMQGSGETRDGLIIHYDGRDRYSIQKCPLTASGACAVDGQTVAVDRTIVPFKSTLGYRFSDQDDIGFGPRVAQDVGGRIKGNHIDIYFGKRRSECKQWGTKLNGEVEIIRLN